MKRIAHIEDEPMIRESVAVIIHAKTNHKVVYSCESIEDFLETYDKKVIPDILLLDIGLPGLSGIEGITQILQKIPTVDIIMFSTYEETDKIYDALCAGACSYVSKRSSPIKVMEAINVVADGGAYMSPVIAKKISTYFTSLKKKSKVELSDRQKEVIELIAQGISQIEIGKRLFISHNTVKTHVKRIYELLNINSKADLLKKYYGGEI